jgi:hypothetical protein
VEESEDELDSSLLAKFTFSYMRRFALGCLRMKPEEFGGMLVVDFFDAMGGYALERAENIKVFVSVIRTSTYLGRVSKEDKLSMHDFWSLPWDEDESVAPVTTKEEYEQQVQAAEDFFKKNIKP